MSASQPQSQSDNLVQLMNNFGRAKSSPVKAMRNITIKPSTFSAVIGSLWSEVTPQFSNSPDHTKSARYPYGWSVEPLFGSPVPGCPGKISDFSFWNFFEGNIFSQENTETTLYYLFKLFFTLTNVCIIDRKARYEDNFELNQQD